MTPLLPLCLVLGPLPAPQSTVQLLEEGDLAPDGFGIQFVNEKLVASDGSWVAAVNSLNPNTSVDDFGVRDGAALVVPGQPIPGVPGQTLDFFIDLDHPRADLTAYTGADGNFVGFAVLEDQLLAREDEPTPAFLGLPAGTTWSRLELVQATENGRVALPCQLDIPGGSPTTNSVVVLDTNAAHQVTGGRVAIRVGDTLSNGNTADFVFTGNNETRMNADGEVLWWGFDSAGDGVLCLDDQVVGTEASPTPEPGLSWRSFSGPEVDLNDSGDWVVRAQVTSFPRDVVMSSTGLVARQGQSHPAFPAFTAGNFGFNAPVFIANDGAVAFYVDLTGPPSSEDEAYVIGDQIVVREGVTQVGGNTIVAISDDSRGYRLSRNGRHFIFEADVDDGGTIREGVFLLTRGPGAGYCIAELNSTGELARLDATGSDVAADNDLVLLASRMPVGIFGIFAVSQSQDHVPMAGGGQGTLCLGGQIGRYQTQIQNSGVSGSFDLTVDLTAVPGASGPYAAPAGTTLNFQGWFRDANPGATSNFTNGYSVLLR